MLIFIDTEFTDFVQIDLISIALVTEDGREFYAERNDYRREDCIDFVRAAVVPMLGVSLAPPAPVPNSPADCARGLKRCRSRPYRSSTIFRIGNCLLMPSWATASTSRRPMSARS